MKGSENHPFLETLFPIKHLSVKEWYRETSSGFEGGGTREGGNKWG